MDDAERQAIIDGEHLKLLSAGWFVSAGATAFFSLFGLLYVFLGVMMAFGSAAVPRRPGQPAPEMMGWIFALVGFGLFVLMLVLAALKLAAGLKIRRRRGRVFCMIVAALSCIGVPWGTVLGVCTFLVLGRESVARLYEPAPALPPAPPPSPPGPTDAREDPAARV